MDRQQFATLVDGAIAAIPEEFLERLDNVSFQVDQWADTETLAEVGFDDPRELLGYYRGVPLGERSVEFPAELPDVIILYQGAIEAYARCSGEPLRQVVRETVIHEMAHYFGFSEEEMDRIEALWAERS